MEDWQERVLKEKVELDGRIRKLYAFLTDDDKLRSTDGRTISMLDRQMQAMNEYSSALNERIILF